jgi:ADP-heptose:LPS heptosyltransferase
MASESGTGGARCIRSSTVLLLTSNHVGNTLFCTPAIRLLKKQNPSVSFDVLTMSRRAASVFDNNPDVGKVFCLSSRWRVRRIAARYDLVLGLHGHKTEQYLGDSGMRLLSVGSFPTEIHRADAILEFAGNLVDCAPSDADRHYALEPRSEHFRRIEELLPTGSGNLLVGFHMGTGRTAVHGWKFWYSKRALDRRRWSVENYVGLARLLRETEPRIRFVLTGSTNERFLARRFTDAVHGEVINLVGRTSLLELAALMSSLSAFVTQDNGALLVASATDVPLVALFGPSRPEHTGPYPLRLQHTVIRGDRMDRITSEEVFAAVLDAIRAPFEGARASVSRASPPIPKQEDTG